jgi:hypothetical protein
MFDTAILHGPGDPGGQIRQLAHDHRRLGRIKPTAEVRHQTNPVTVHIPMAVHPAYREHSFDCLLHSLMQQKRKMAEFALWPMGDTDGDAAELQRMVAEGAASTARSDEPVKGAMEAMFARDGLAVPAWKPDGSLEL